MENFPVGESEGSVVRGKAAQNESKGSAASGKAAQSESALEQMPKFCQLILLTLIKFLYLSEDFE